tara:strand:+ start:175 stop:786 length:612 start_codon:yes stop_codon:yes gene_type:complete
MPNWCNNNIIIKGPKKKIKDLEAAAKEGQFCNWLVAMPKVLEDTTADGTEKPKLKKATGFSDWYDWRVANWGTKWDVDAYEGSIKIKEELLGKDNGKAELSFGFDSAWAPPLEAIATYLEKNDDVSMKLWYYEPGCDFGGVWEDFNDDCWQISEVQDSFLINDPVGREFNDYFGLLESREEWRADEENDPKSVAKWKAVQGAE